MDTIQEISSEDEGSLNSSASTHSAASNVGPLIGTTGDPACTSTSIPEDLVKGNSDIDGISKDLGKIKVIVKRESGSQRKKRRRRQAAAAEAARSTAAIPGPSTAAGSTGGPPVGAPGAHSGAGTSQGGKVALRNKSKQTVTKGTSSARNTGVDSEGSGTGSGASRLSSGIMNPPKRSGTKPANSEGGSKGSLKRQMQPGSTPPEGKLGKRRRGADTSQGASYALVVAEDRDLQVVVTREVNPDLGFNGDQLAEFLDAAGEAVPSEGGMAVQFLSTRLWRGQILVTAANQISRRWLLETLPHIRPWGPDVGLVAADPERFRLRRATLWIPGKKHPSNEIAMARLASQNPSLGCSGWRVWSRKEEPTGLSLVVGIGENSVAPLAGIGNRPFYGLTRARLLILSPSRNENEAGTSEVSLPFAPTEGRGQVAAVTVSEAASGTTLESVGGPVRAGSPAGLGEAGETEAMGGALDSAPIPGARGHTASSDEESSDSEGGQNTTVVERE